MEQVTELQDELEVVLRELIPLRNETVPLDEAIDLGKFLRQLKVTLKYLISTHLKLSKLMETVKDEDAKSTKSDGSAKAKGATSIKLPKLSIPKFDRDVLNWRTFWEQFGVSIHSRPQLSDVEKLARHSRASTDGRHLLRCYQVSAKQV